MKDSVSYKLISSLIVVFIAALAVGFMFIGTGTVEGNVWYYVFKGVCLFWLLCELIGIWVSKGGFSKYFPLTLGGVAIQVFPAFLRIGFKDGVRAPWSIAIVIICAILVFVTCIIGLTYGVSNKSFREAEQKAKHSSNYTGK